MHIRTKKESKPNYLTRTCGAAALETAIVTRIRCGWEEVPVRRTYRERNSDGIQRHSAREKERALKKYIYIRGIK